VNSRWSVPHIYSYITKKLRDANENDNKFDIKAMLKAKKIISAIFNGAKR